jgi:hypothetical protein
LTFGNDETQATPFVTIIMGNKNTVIAKFCNSLLPKPKHKLREEVGSILDGFEFHIDGDVR